MEVELELLIHYREFHESIEMATSYIPDARCIFDIAIVYYVLPARAACFLSRVYTYITNYLYVHVQPLYNI